MKPCISCKTITSKNFPSFKVFKGISKNAPFPLQWRGIKGEAKQIIRVLGMRLS